MSREEFATVMAYLSAGCGKPLSADAHEVYYDLLGDLPLAALQVAAKEALLESGYPVFPPVGTLRRLATAALLGAHRLPTPAEAWERVRGAIAAFGYCREEQGLAVLPSLTRRAAQALGWQSLCDATKPEVARAQFMAAYEALATRELRQALLPAPIRDAADLISDLADTFRLEDRTP